MRANFRRYRNAEKYSAIHPTGAPSAEHVLTETLLDMRHFLGARLQCLQTGRVEHLPGTRGPYREA